MVFIFLLICNTVWTGIGSSHVKFFTLVIRFLREGKAPPVQLTYIHSLQKLLQPGKESIPPATAP